MTFGTLLLDPPWPERGGGKVKRGADRHYKLASVDAIPRIVYGSGVFDPAPDAHLWIWTTNNYLPFAIGLFPSFGFRYVTNTAWVKMRAGVGVNKLEAATIDLAREALQIGLGQYQRGSHELLLFGVRGRAMVPPPVARFPSVVFAPRGAHSRKPDVFYDRIERVSPAPRVELFARSRRPNWAVWGDGVED